MVLVMLGPYLRMLKLQGIKLIKYDNALQEMLSTWCFFSGFTLGRLPHCPRHGVGRADYSSRTITCSLRIHRRFRESREPGTGKLGVTLNVNMNKYRIGYKRNNLTC